MKHFIVFLFFGLLSPMAAAFDIGFQGSVGQNKLIGDDVDSEIHEEVGYRFGLVSRINLTEYLDLRTGILYSHRKYQVITPSLPPPFGTGSDTKYEVQANYVDVPVLAQFKALTWLNIYAGPVIAFNLNGKIKGNDSLGPIDEKIDDDLTSPYLLGQAGINFDFGRIGLDFYYERGFNDVFKDGDGTFTFIGMNLNFWLFYSDSSEYDSSPYRSTRSRGRSR